MWRFMENDHEIILKCRWGSEVLHAPQLVHDGALVRFQGAKHWKCFAVLSQEDK